MIIVFTDIIKIYNKKAYFVSKRFFFQFNVSRLQQAKSHFLQVSSYSRDDAVMKPQNDNKRVYIFKLK